VAITTIFLDQILPLKIGNLSIQRDMIYESNGKKYFVTHGDVFDRDEKKILLGKTILANAKKIGFFRRSLIQIHQLIQETAPDIILNFYDLLDGLYNGFFRPKATYWVIGHQYLIFHPSFKFASYKGLEKFCFKLNTRLTANCRGLVSTVGFESICEAMYLGKPVMVIPVQGQYEQACNALDTVHSGAGIASEDFDFSKLEKLLQMQFIQVISIQDWVNTWPETFQQMLPKTKMTESEL
jgi:hypothetical protein